MQQKRKRESKNSFAKNVWNSESASRRETLDDRTTTTTTKPSRFRSRENRAELQGDQCLGLSKSRPMSTKSRPMSIKSRPISIKSPNVYIKSPNVYKKSPNVLVTQCIWKVAQCLQKVTQCLQKVTQCLSHPMYMKSRPMSKKSLKADYNKKCAEILFLEATKSIVYKIHPKISQGRFQ